MTPKPSFPDFGGFGPCRGRTRSQFTCCFRRVSFCVHSRFLSATRTPNSQNHSYVHRHVCHLGRLLVPPPIFYSECWATPPVRLGLSGRNSRTSGKTPETLSERFLEFPSRVRLGCPKPYNSRHLRLPERFQNSLPPSTAGGASFFKIGSGEGLSELVMEFPAVPGVTQKCFSKLEAPLLVP